MNRQKICPTFLLDTAIYDVVGGLKAQPVHTFGKL